MRKLRKANEEEEEEKNIAVRFLRFFLLLYLAFKIRPPNRQTDVDWNSGSRNRRDGVLLRYAPKWRRLNTNEKGLNFTSPDRMVKTRSEFSLENKKTDEQCQTQKEDFYCPRSLLRRL